MFSIEKEELWARQAQPRITDQQILLYIWTVIQRFRQRQQQNSIQCILCEQKLIHLTMLIHHRQPHSPPYNIKDQIINFVQKINKLTMENVKENSGGPNAKFISKAVDVVMLPEISKYVTDTHTLSKLKILTFNNLACILKKQKHYMMALKAVSFAIDLEHQLLNSCKQEERYDIVPTYLNKAAVLSEMGKHAKAIEQIRKARVYAETIQKEVQVQLAECNSEDLKKRLEEKRHYGCYMKMLISYNMGVEKQHQKLLNSAILHYQQSKKLAISINNQFMANKLEDIILKLKNQ